MDATANLGRNPVSKHHIHSAWVWRCAGWRVTGLPNPSRETKFSGANADREMFISLFSWPRAGLATLPGWFLLLLDVWPYIHTWPTCVDQVSSDSCKANTLKVWINMEWVARDCLKKIWTHLDLLSIPFCFKKNLNASKPSNRENLKARKIWTQLLLCHPYNAGRDCRNLLAIPNSQARTRTGKYSFSLFSRPRAGLATLLGWFLLLLYGTCDHTYMYIYIHTSTHVVVVVVFTLKAVPVSTHYFLISVLVQLTRTPSVVTG